MTKSAGKEKDSFRHEKECPSNQLKKKIIDLEKANQQLRILVEDYRSQFENVTDVVILVGADFNLLSLSPSVEKLLGYKVEDLINRPVFELKHIFTPESFQRATDKVIKVLKGENVPAGHYDFITKDGTLKHVELQSSPLIRDGRIQGVISVARDITKRKEAEISLSKSEKRFSSIFHFNPDPIAITEMATGKIIDVNEAFLNWTGYSREEVIGVSTQDLHIWNNPDDREKIIGELQKSGEVKNAEINLRQKNGNLRQMLFSASFVEIDQDRYLLTLAHDITQRKQAEEKLRREEQQFRALAEQTPDMIVLINRDIKVTYVNPAVERFLGRKQEEIIGSYLYTYPHPDDLDLVVEIFTTFFKDTSPNVQRAEIRLRDKDGAWHIVDAVGTNLVRDNVAEAVIVNLRDITDRKRAEEKLLLIQKAVEDSGDAIALADAQGNHFYQNKSFTRLLGYTVDELKVKGVAQTVYADQEVARDVFETIMNGGSWSGEVEDIAKDGRRLTVMLRADAIKDETGKIIGLLAINTDITERKQMENELRISESNFRHSLDESPLGIRISTKEGETIYANKAILDIYEYGSIEELKNTSIKERYTPKSYAEFLERKKKRLKGEFGPSEYTISIVTKNGQIRHLQVFRKEIFWDGKKQSQIIYQDITERKLAEEKLQQTLDSLKKAVGTTIQVLVSALEARDPYTSGHQSRSADLACAISAEMGLPEETIEGIRMAGTIHDIGKLSVPAEILTKPTKLTNLEFSLIKEHPRCGYEMLKDVESPWALAEIVHQHHERMNGTGYPRKLKGHEILLEARILAVADVVEAMASHRPYRPSLGIAAALDEIEKNKGILYDANVADACLRLFKEKNYQLA
ncbi:MAG TPA: PAS domain S-box protein [Smithella sp.]|nr:PAS domain S-box protein [Smithella sp.]HOG91339.1 PAS domain S-box protein [Smithella sp.]